MFHSIDSPLMRIRLFSLTVLVCLGTALSAAPETWSEKLTQNLPLLGHRNWIVVTDAAYPWQTAPGIETVFADAELLTVVDRVLAELAKTRHVKPTVYLDSELSSVSEKNAPGIGAFRDALRARLAKQPVIQRPHEQVIADLDQAGKTFKVLITKTPLVLPYTSVFFQLDCGYWDAAAEKALRQAMKP